MPSIKEIAKNKWEENLQRDQEQKARLDSENETRFTKMVDEWIKVVGLPRVAYTISKGKHWSTHLIFDGEIYVAVTAPLTRMMYVDTSYATFEVLLQCPNRCGHTWSGIPKSQSQLEELYFKQFEHERMCKGG